MAETIPLHDRAARVQTADFTAGHQQFRQHLEDMRILLCDISLLVDEDSAKSSTWLRGRKPASGAVGWLARLFLSISLRGHGKNMSDAILEAAKSVVRMAAVHQEYIVLESAHAKPGSSGGGRGSGRYRTETV